MADTPSPSPPPCAKGCGFFGSPSTMNMCSKCFREHQRSNPQQEPAASDPSSGTGAPPAPAAASSVASNVATFSTPIMRPAAGSTAAASLATPAPDVEKKADVALAAPDAAIAADPTAPPPRKVQKNTSRCFSCKKRIGLTGFKCNCGYFFCSEHRYSDKHDCDFDYQASAREQLEKANPVVVASKLEKI